MTGAASSAAVAHLNCLRAAIDSFEREIPSIERWGAELARRCNPDAGALRDDSTRRPPPGRRRGLARPFADGERRDVTAEPKVDGRVSRAQRLRESRRAGVLAVARRIFSQKGYHATSIHDIIETAEIARGTFYLYFESKRAIFDELLDGLVTTLQAQVKRIEVGADAPPPVDQ